MYHYRYAWTLSKSVRVLREKRYNAFTVELLMFIISVSPSKVKYLNAHRATISFIECLREQLISNKWLISAVFTFGVCDYSKRIKTTLSQR